jgi:hypothetical protein
MMATRDSSHIMLLKEEVRGLSEELVQCQVTVLDGIVYVVNS